MIRIAVLGCGRIGRMHAKNIVIHPRTELAVVHDLHQPAADELALAMGVRVATSANAVFASADIDAILVATATETHADYIEQAVGALKPVLCEKPIDLRLERVNACAKAVVGSRVPIQLGFNRRFDPGHRAARNAMRAGDIGTLHQVIITSRDPAMPLRAYYEQAGGLLRDMSIHDFDMARFLLDDEPVEVFAVGGRLIDRALMDELDDYDTAMIILRTADGKQCHINNSRTATYGHDQRIELLGSAGMVQSNNRKSHELQRFAAHTSEMSEPYQLFFTERYSEAFMASLTAFVECIENDTAPEVGFEDGRAALVLAEAAYLSIRESRMVRVSEIDS